MDRTELAALRDAIDQVLAWPDSVRAQVAAWLSPAAPKPGNGLDPHQTGKTPAKPRGPGMALRQMPHPARAGRWRRTPARRAAASRDLGGLRRATASNGDAGAFGRERGCVGQGRGREPLDQGERLRGLAARGVVTKDAGGHWRLTADLAGEVAGPQQAPPST